MLIKRKKKLSESEKSETIGKLKDTLQKRGRLWACKLRASLGQGRAG